MGGDGGGGGSALKDIMSGTVAGFAQVAVGEKNQSIFSDFYARSRILFCLLSTVLVQPSEVFCITASFD